MENISINRLKLLEIVKDNRNRHRAVFEEAIEGYRTKAIAEMEANINRAKSGERFARSLTLLQPVDQTPEYDRAIRMLELHTGETLSIDEHTFANLVEDNWSWTKHWALSNSSYVSQASNRDYLSTKQQQLD